MRNVNKQIEQGNAITKERRALDLSLSEIDALYKRFTETEATQGKSSAIIDIIGAAYSFGLAVGNRNA